MNKIIQQLTEIGLQAIEVENAQIAVRIARSDLEHAYQRFRVDVLGDDPDYGERTYIERDSGDWDTMMRYSKPQYEALVQARATLKNAKRRLSRTIKKAML